MYSYVSYAQSLSLLIYIKRYSVIVVDMKRRLILFQKFVILIIINKTKTFTCILFSLSPTETFLSSNLRTSVFACCLRT